MKSIILICAMLFATNSYAHQVDKSFIEFKARHKIMVNNDYESFINTQSMEHEDYPSLSQAVSQIMSNDSESLEGMKLDKVFGKKRTDQVIDRLMGGDYPFFCTTLNKSGDWDEDAPNCISNLMQLFGDVIEKADNVAVLELWGNYYGIWATTYVILQNEDTNESLIIEFDIIHEI